MEKITLSANTERAILLSQLNEKSAILISMNDIALMTGLSYDTVQQNLTKQPDFPKPSSLSKKNLTYISGDIVRWIKRNSRHNTN